MSIILMATAWPVRLSTLHACQGFFRYSSSTPTQEDAFKAFWGAEKEGGGGRGVITNEPFVDFAKAPTA